MVGGNEKSVLHSLRAKLRYTRERLKAELAPVKKKELERELESIEAEIEKQVKWEESKG